MKKPIIIAFALIFALFGLGSGIAIYHLITTTENLRHIISLHEIDDIRQELSFGLQKIENYSFSSADFFARHLDEIADNVEIVDNAYERCYECHHEPAVQAELAVVGEMINEYQRQLSYLITTASEGKRRRDLQIRVANQGNAIHDQVHDMSARAVKTLTIKTSLVMQNIDRSHMILAATFALTFLVALVIFRILTGFIIRPINELLTAANKITKGELGYQSSYQGRAEFKSLIATFNQMSESLALKQQKIRENLEKLNHLNLMTLPLHSAQDTITIFNHLRAGINTLLEVDYVGILLAEEENGRFLLSLFESNDMQKEAVTSTFKNKDILAVFDGHKGQPMLLNDINNDSWPFGDGLPENFALKNLLVAWIMNKDQVSGALIAFNKKEPGFVDEDMKISGILANNMSVALENSRLYRNTQDQMTELKKTQRQLIEAEKLTALGTLAGGVAHDFNNILCGMIGYVSLLKRNHEPDGNDFKMLDSIEKAGFRAANLTKQLLTFSCQEAQDHRPIDVNGHIENVAKLLEITISKMITIRLALTDSLPPVLSDPAQLEQVVMNLSVNARDAMPNGGEIFIQSEKATVDEQFCEQHPEAKPGEYIKLTVIDQGKGIDQESLPRIFEPFFTTKEPGKGPGLGLAMVYGIVKSHKGFLIVASTPGKGSSFAVYLPVAGTSEEEVQPHPDDQEMKANILIVDDEELVVAMLAEHLHNLGCQTFQASNGREALEILAQHPDELDAVILDINMPVMDGKTAFEKMVDIKPGLKVLVASGYSLGGQAEELLQKGAHGFIQKPYRLDNIVEKIKQVLNQG